MISPVFDFLYKVSQKRGTGNREKGGYHDEEQDPDGEGCVAVEGEKAGLLLKTDLRDTGFDFLSVIAADAYSLF